MNKPIDYELLLVEICRVLATNSEESLGRRDKLRKLARKIDWQRAGVTEQEFWAWIQR